MIVFFMKDLMRIKCIIPSNVQSRIGPTSEFWLKSTNSDHFRTRVVKLPCFQEGDDGQEDTVEVEKKEELGEKANSEYMVVVNRPVDCT